MSLPSATPASSSAGDRSGAAETCPVDHKNMSKEELASFMAKHKRQHPFVAPVNDDSADRCPVDHENMSKDDIAAFMHKQRGSNFIAEPQGSAYDAKASTAGASTVEYKRAFDVYGQEINPANNMPATPNQLPSPGQVSRLSTDRIASSIPKSEADTTWTYPSPQMFYNALKRKGKADDVDEGDMDSVVAIHNSMNETTWREVMDWERRFHCDECPDPKLRKFEGRPHDLSPAAHFRTFFRGYPIPFDRHDWVVDRCGKQDVRYIIDYYYREQTPGGDPIEIHVRPALDSPSAAWDQLRHGLAGLLNKASTVVGGNSGASRNPNTAAKSAPPATAQDPPPHAVGSSASAPVDDAEFDFLRALTSSKIEELSGAISEDCKSFGKMLAECGEDDAACEQANIALNYCMASKLCKPQAQSFMKAMESDAGAEASSYAEMTSCLERFNVMARRVMMHAAGLSQPGPEQ
jgi:cytochrome c heme-lyase